MELLRVEGSPTSPTERHLEVVEQSGVGVIIAHNPSEFVPRANGGCYCFTAVKGSGIPTAGATLAAGAGSWTSWSDRNGKKHFHKLDPQTVLEKVAALPVTEWNWKTQYPSIRHIGPMAQDFHAAFGLGGGDDRHITASDADGAALTAIQGLNTRLEEKEACIADLDTRLAVLQKLVQERVASPKASLSH